MDCSIILYFCYFINCFITFFTPSSINTLISLCPPFSTRLLPTRLRYCCPHRGLEPRSVASQWAIASAKRYLSGIIPWFLCDPTILRSKINFRAFRDFCVKYRSSRRGCPGRYPAEAEGRAWGKPSLEISVIHRRLRSPESPYCVSFSSVSRANLSLLSHPQRYKFYMLREKKYRFACGEGVGSHRSFEGFSLRLKGLCHTESTESTERFACGGYSFNINYR